MYNPARIALIHRTHIPQTHTQVSIELKVGSLLKLVNEILIKF